jgi:hypothetical protein
MTCTLPKDTYTDPEYEAAHRATFEPPMKNPITKVLPPGVTAEDFSKALVEFGQAVGTSSVFVEDALAHYIDPFEVYIEDESKRKVPSAAVW